MNASVRELFREVADIPAQEREKILAARRIPADLRAEVESLLDYDSASGESLTRLVFDAAEEALGWSSGPVSGYCGPYRLVRLLGSGGMGAVYLAERRDGEIEQQVAIKLLRADADRPAWRARFLRERQLLAYLNHPSIARLLDAGHTDDGRPYLVMEYVDGVAIDEYAAALDLRAQLMLFLHLCDGISHAHRHLIVHRDLKPSNILVDTCGRPKLLDFGIAKLLDATTNETRTIERLLTPGYASPEQLRGEAQTAATDIYSLGAVLYRVLTGRSAREPSSPATGFMPPTRLNPKLPRDIDHILRKALRHEPEERYVSVDAFAEDVRAFLELRPVAARSADRWYRMRKFLRHRRAAVAATAIATTGLWLGLCAANRQRAIAQGLAFEVGDAYSLLARAQGISMASTAEERTQAGESLRRANLFVEPVLSASPHNRKALLTAARIHHDRMILAENERRNGEAIAEAREAVAYLERFIGLGALSAAESETASELFYGIALSQKNQHLAEDGMRYVRLHPDRANFAPCGTAAEPGIQPAGGSVAVQRGSGRGAAGDQGSACQPGEGQLSQRDRTALRLVPGVGP